MTGWIYLVLAVLMVITLAIGLVWSFATFLDWLLAR